MFDFLWLVLFKGVGSVWVFPAIPIGDHPRMGLWWASASALPSFPLHPSSLSLALTIALQLTSKVVLCCRLSKHTASTSKRLVMTNVHVSPVVQSVHVLEGLQTTGAWQWPRNLETGPVLGIYETVMYKEQQLLKSQLYVMQTVGTPVGFATFIKISTTSVKLSPELGEFL